MSTVTTSVRMSKETKQRLKVLSAKIGKSQSELIDKYVRNGLSIDEKKINKKNNPGEYSVEQIIMIFEEDVEKDKEKGIENNGKNLDSLEGIIDLGYVTDSVKIKKEDD